MKKFWAWLLLSSKDPAKASLTIKSILTASATYILFFTGLFHYTLGASDLTVIIDQIANVVGIILMLISGVTALWATVRKIILTILGSNEVVNSGTTL